MPGKSLATSLKRKRNRSRVEGDKHTEAHGAAKIPPGCVGRSDRSRLGAGRAAESSCVPVPALTVAEKLRARMLEPSNNMNCWTANRDCRVVQDNRHEQCFADVQSHKWKARLKREIDDPAKDRSFSVV